jgi:hypothetical protein
MGLSAGGICCALLVTCGVAEAPKPPLPPKPVLVAVWPKPLLPKPPVFAVDPKPPEPVEPNVGRAPKALVDVLPKPPKVRQWQNYRGCAALLLLVRARACCSTLALGLLLGAKQAAGALLRGLPKYAASVLLRLLLLLLLLLLLAAKGAAAEACARQSYVRNNPLSDQQLTAASVSRLPKARAGRAKQTATLLLSVLVLSPRRAKHGYD